MKSINRQQASRLPIGITSTAPGNSSGSYDDGPQPRDSQASLVPPGTAGGADPGSGPATELSDWSAQREQKLHGRVLCGRYRLLSRLGMGAMGEVYRAIDLERQRPCAVKLVAADVSVRLKAHERFKNEAQMVSQLSHPNIIEVYEFNQDSDGTAFLVMELLEGADLHAVLSHTGRLPLPRALHILTEIGAGLHYAHALGIVHRDIKPNNIFLCRQPMDGGRSQDAVKILDFGLAKLISDSHYAAADGQDEQRHLTKGLVVGTPAYMPPETLTGETPGVDPRSDQWALAVIAYEMLGGRLPFEHENPYQLCLRICTEEPRPLRSLSPGLPPHVYCAIEVAMSKRREQRFTSIADFTRALANKPRQVSDPLPSAAATAAPALVPPPAEPPSPLLLRSQPTQDLLRTVQYTAEELLLLTEKTRQPVAATPVELLQEAKTVRYRLDQPDPAWQSPFQRAIETRSPETEPPRPQPQTAPLGRPAAAAEPLDRPVVGSGAGRLPRRPPPIDFSQQTPLVIGDANPFASSQLVLTPKKPTPWLTLGRGLLLCGVVLGLGLLLLLSSRANLRSDRRPPRPTRPAAAPPPSQPATAELPVADPPPTAPPPAEIPAPPAARPPAAPPLQRPVGTPPRSRVAMSARPPSTSPPLRRPPPPTPQPAPVQSGMTAVEQQILDSF